MSPEEEKWWKDNRNKVYGLSPFDYLILLKEGVGLFSWSNKRVSFLKRWWWGKFEKAWREKMDYTQKKLL